MHSRGFLPSHAAANNVEWMLAIRAMDKLSGTIGGCQHSNQWR
jgi:hypothetical protein